MNDDVEIPVAFWRTLSNDEALLVLRRGHFNRGQVVRLWEFLERTDEPPPRIEVMVSRSDVERVYPRRVGG